MINDQNKNEWISQTIALIHSLDDICLDKDIKEYLLEIINKFGIKANNYAEMRELEQQINNNPRFHDYNRLDKLRTKFRNFEPQDFRVVIKLSKHRAYFYQNKEEMEQEIIPNHQRASNILSILHEHLKKIIPEIPKTKIKKNAKSDWIRSIYHPTLEKNSRKVKRKVKALAIIALIFSGMLIGTYFYLSTFYIDTTFNASKFKVDVNEEITFNWNILGTFSRGAAVFGDGFSVDLNGTSDTVKHSYSVQGKYAPIIRVWNQYGVSISKSLCVEIKNYAPQFEVSVPNSAYEDELVRVSVVDLVESEVDLENGVIKYVYDFADNNQTTTSQNSIVHKWENAGAYPVTITLFDDQSALSQKTEYIEIINKAPEAYFDHIITDGIVESLGTICKRKFI